MLENLLGKSPLPVLSWAVDRDLKFITENGFIPNIDLSPHRSIYSYLDTEENDSFPINVILQALENKSVSYNSQRKGRDLWTTCSPMLDHHGNVVGIVGTSWDITAVKTVISQLEKFADDLPAAEIYSLVQETKALLTKICTPD